jgi:hypothetical protein
VGAGAYLNGPFLFHLAKHFLPRKRQVAQRPTAELLHASVKPKNKETNFIT